MDAAKRAAWDLGSTVARRDRICESWFKSRVTVCGSGTVEHALPEIIYLLLDKVRCYPAFILGSPTSHQPPQISVLFPTNVNIIVHLRYLGHL